MNITDIMFINRHSKAYDNRVYNKEKGSTSWQMQPVNPFTNKKNAQIFLVAPAKDLHYSALTSGWRVLNWVLAKK